MPADPAALLDSGFCVSYKTMGGDWNPIGCAKLVLLLFLNVHASQNLVRCGVPPVRDCSQIKSQHPEATSGLYMIQPAGVPKPFKVFCEMQSDGGWTVFQKRSGGEVSFRKDWLAYKHGFGNPQSDHWLGLQRLWAITKAGGSRWALRVDLWDFEGGSAFAEYRDFKLGNESQAYRLEVWGYYGTAGDAIRGRDPSALLLPGLNQNCRSFSTLDRDNYSCAPCAFGNISADTCSHEEGGGGWWYSRRCGLASLHGEWHPAGKNWDQASGLHWFTWKDSGPYSARATRMMVKAHVANQ
ncbi:angiopoietin-4-like isoform X2 [Anguilla anguilla]|uniref:angiopoietin-4-like isoform X2 n=1 Tax=Anguilla anguilla TaxID=7936 RepID=UPI0015A90309|nr:angiopoietin-4-like isoform X2 [Anguilla anguilla]